MGSGPATYLASQKNAYSLLLMSPYTSIKDVAKSLFGKLSFLVTPLVYERFRNIDAIQESKCPVFFLHGKKDKLIPHQHTLDLQANCPQISFLQLPTDMDHNVFDFDEDLIKPFKAFLKKIDDSIGSEKRRALLHPLKKASVQVSHMDSAKVDASEVKYRDPNNEGKPAEGDGDSNNASSSSEEEDDGFELVNSGERFEIVFDKGIFEPPQIIKLHHAHLEQVAKA
jgi:hypothetical protein